MLIEIDTDKLNENIERYIDTKNKYSERFELRIFKTWLNEYFKNEMKKIDEMQEAGRRG
jgi:hypothetical protein